MTLVKQLVKKGIEPDVSFELSLPKSKWKEWISNAAGGRCLAGYTPYMRQRFNAFKPKEVNCDDLRWNRNHVVYEHSHKAKAAAGPWSVNANCKVCKGVFYFTMTSTFKELRKEKVTELKMLVEGVGVESHSQSSDSDDASSNPNQGASPCQKVQRPLKKTLRNQRVKKRKSKKLKVKHASPWEVSDMCPDDNERQAQKNTPPENIEQESSTIDDAPLLFQHPGEDGFLYYFDDAGQQTYGPQEVDDILRAISCGANLNQKIESTSTPLQSPHQDTTSSSLLDDNNDQTTTAPNSCGVMSQVVDSTVSAEHESEVPVCPPCKKPVVNGTTCVICGILCHQQPQCSSPEMSTTSEEASGMDKRVCHRCLCEHCRLPRHTGLCVCRCCNSLIDSHAVDLCLHCNQRVHALCKMSDTEWCLTCVTTGAVPVCPTCKKPVVNGTTCVICGILSHEESLCSLPDPSYMVDGVEVRDARVCRGCLCKFCRFPRHLGHQCKCYICNILIVDKVELCLNCQQPTHALCRVPDKKWCHACVSTGKTGISKGDMDILKSTAMLTDTLITKAMEMLGTQFPSVQGLQTPIAGADSLDPFGEEHQRYPPSCYAKTHIQVLNTGGDHWVTSYKPKGTQKFIYVLNSSGSTQMGGFLEQQLAVIMKTQGDSFTVIHPQVKIQHGGINECGPLAIAYATELAYTEEISYVNFKLKELRPHLLKCFLSGEITRFPHSAIKPSKRLSIEHVKVYCRCRLPEHFDKVQVKCSRCRVWFHLRCEGLKSAPSSRHWCCQDCSKVTK